MPRAFLESVPLSLKNGLLTTTFKVIRMEVTKVYILLCISLYPIARTQKLQNGAVMTSSQ